LRLELERERLLRLLEHGDDLKLIALIAPSGYGKTTLLAQYARSPQWRTVWVNLGADSADPERLGETVHQALTQVAPELALEPGGRIVAERLARALDQAEDNLRFVFDGIDQLAMDAGRWLHLFIAALAEGHRVLVAGRDGSALPLARFVAEGSAQLIGPEELAFTTDECASYLQARQIKLDPEAVAEKLEGWPAGLALTASSATSGSRFGLEPTELVREALRGLPDAVRLALPEAAVLEVWSDDAAQAAGLVLPADWLHEVRRAGLPITPLEATTYRPHRLLIEALERELRARPERHQILHLEAAKRAESQERPLEALGHYQAARAMPQALGLAQRISEGYAVRWEYRLVRRVLESFPEDTLTPELAATLGAALIETGEATRGEILAQRVLASGQARPWALHTLGSLAGYRGQHEAQLQMVEEAIKLNPPESLRARLIRVRTWGLMDQGRFQEALDASIELIAWSERHHVLTELSSALTLAQVAYMLLGRLGESERTGRRALEVFEMLGWPARSLHLMNNIADMFRTQGRFEEARELLERGLGIARREQHKPMIAQLLQTRADVLAWQGLFHQATEDYQASIRACAGLGIDALAQVSRMRLTDTARRTGQSDLVEHALRRIREHVPPEEGVLYGTYQFTEGLSAFAANDLDAAENHLAWLERAEADPSDRARALAYRAEIARRQDRLEHGQIERLIERLNVFGVDAALAMDAIPLAGLYLECQRRGWWPERFGAFTTDTLTITPEATGLELHLRTFGTVRVCIANEPVRIALAKSLEMLVWLALNGPASREQIMDALWDGSNEQRHIEYFKVSVRRLRAALSEHPMVGFNPLTFETGRYALNPEFRVDMDAVHLESGLRQPAPEAVLNTLEVYNGDFLREIESLWAEEARSRYRELALSAVRAAARTLESTDPRAAMDAYRRLTIIEPLEEDAYLDAIRCGRASGDTHATWVAYTEYRQMLDREYGRKPDPALRREFER
jgi:LuxR family maltose regulon positive regulatory protein